MSIDEPNCRKTIYCIRTDTLPQYIVNPHSYNYNIHYPSGFPPQHTVFPSSLGARVVDTAISQHTPNPRHHSLSAFCQNHPDRRKVDDTLTAEIFDENDEEVEDTEDFTYQWYLDGDKIEDETDAELEVSVGMIGSTIKVEVTDPAGNVISSEETEEVVLGEILEEAEMISSKKVAITFGLDASELVNKDNLKITSADETTTIPVTSLEFSLDGTMAEATLAVALTDGTTYTVSYEDSEVEFTAEFGEVASVEILTTEAEVNVDTDIKFVLFDANGVDVTDSVDVANRVTIDVEGDTSNFSVSDPENATLQMDKEGNTATVTVTYTPDDGTDEDEISDTQVVTCVKATEKKGAGVFYQTSKATEINANSSSAKFYNGLSNDSLTLTEGTLYQNIYFYAADANGEAVNYDLYEAVGADEDVLSATADVTEGKFAKIDVTGLKVGSTTLVVSAEKNGVKSTYTIPVTVVKSGKLKNVKLTITNGTLTNAIEDDYFGTIEAKVYDTNGTEITKRDDVNINFEIAETTDFGAASLVDVEGIDDELLADGFDVKGDAKAKRTFTADGAKAGSYYVNVTASDGSGDTAHAQAKITVQAISEDLWNIAANTKPGGTLTYAVELGATTIDEAKGDDAIVHARLKALSGSKFVGYVNPDGSVGNATETAEYTPSEAEDATAHITYTANVDEDLDGITFITKKGAAAELGQITLAGVTFTSPVENEGALDGVEIKLMAASGSGSDVCELAEVGGTYTITFTPDAAPADEEDLLAGIQEAELSAALDALEDTDEKKIKANDILTALGNVGVSVPDGGAGYAYATGTQTFSGYVAEVPASVAVSEDGLTVTYTFGESTAAADIEEEYAALATGVAVKFDAEASITPAVGTLEGVESDGYTMATIKSPIKISNETKIDQAEGVKYTVKFGSVYSKATATKAIDVDEDAINDNVLGLYDHVINFGTYKKTDAAVLAAGSDFFLDTLTDTPAHDGRWVYAPNEVSMDEDFAKVGTYTVYFMFYDGGKNKVQDGKLAEKSGTLKVTNTIKVPKVTSFTRTTKGATVADFKDVLHLNVDLNNKDGNAESLVGLVGKYTATGRVVTEAAEKDNKVVVKYAVVEENVFGAPNDVDFWVPVENTFTVK